MHKSRLYAIGQSLSSAPSLVLTKKRQLGKFIKEKNQLHASWPGAACTLEFCIYINRALTQNTKKSSSFSHDTLNGEYKCAVMCATTTDWVFVCVKFRRHLLNGAMLLTEPGACTSLCGEHPPTPPLSVCIQFGVFVLSVRCGAAQTVSRSLWQPVSSTRNQSDAPFRQRPLYIEV